ncbi:MAG: TlpA family protein disulfide reductase [Bergeyella sp.]|nr:TlpA family protein disulfide reductase [Bergeyella sp.]
MRGFFRKKALFFIILVGIIGVLVFSSKAGVVLKKYFSPSAMVLQRKHLTKEDYELELKGINTADINLKSIYGKAVFLNFWATWCPPCTEEWPSIQALYNSQNENIVFVLIAMKDEEDAVKKFLERNKYTVPVYIAQSPIPETLLPRVFPTTYLLDNKGFIKIKETGLKNWNTLEIQNMIKNLSE